MGSSDIAIHDLQIAMERGVRDICEVTAKMAESIDASGEPIMDAIAACTRPAAYEKGGAVPGGYVATDTFTLHLVTGQAVSVGVNDEILVKSGAIKVLNRQHRNVKVVATGNVAFVTYHLDENHLW